MKGLFGETLDELRRQMGRHVCVPGSAKWRVEPGARPAVVATMPATDLSKNVQDDKAAVPSFALCLAWWFEHFALLAGSVKARVEITGDVSRSQHGHRSLFLLHEFELLLPRRFTCTPKQELPWPKRPLVNACGARDAVAMQGSDTERAIECAFTTQPQVVEQFAAIDPIEGFRRQLPVGIFEGSDSENSRWSPGRKSQVDLWAVAQDGLTVHLFELKKPGRCKLGILPRPFGTPAFFIGFGWRTSVASVSPGAAPT